MPKPKLVVFYNGQKEIEDTTLSLSDSFNDNTNIESDISVNVKMININYGNNVELLNKCRILDEYSWLIDKIRTYDKTMEVSDAVGNALKEMPDSYALKPFLLMNKSEVTDMCITEYNEAETLKAIGDESFAEGKAEGRIEGKIEGKIEGLDERKAEEFKQINQMLADGEISKETAELLKDRFNIS